MLEVVFLELLARLAQGQVVGHGRSGGSACRLRLGTDGLVDLIRTDLLAAAKDQQALNEVLQLADIPRPGVVAQTVLRGDAEMAITQFLVADEVIDVEIQQVVHVILVLAQRRDIQRHHVQMVEQIVTETAGGHFLLQVALRRGDDAQVDPDLLVAANTGKGVGLEYAQQPRLGLQVHVGDVADAQRAAVGLLQAAVMDGLAVLVPEQLGGGVLDRYGPHGDLDERAVTARALLVDVARKRALAGTGLAADQHPAVVPGDLARLLPQLLHGIALAYRLQYRLDALPEVDVFLLQTRALEGALDGQQQLGQRYGLLYEVIGAEPGRLHGRLDRAVAGHHDNGAGQVTAFRPFAQQADTVDILHPDIQQYQVGTTCTSCVARAFTALRGGYGVALVFQDIANQVANLRFIVNNQNVTCCHRCYFRCLVVGPLAG